MTPEPLIPPRPEETLYRAALTRVFPGSVPRSYEPMAGGISSEATRWDVELPDGVVRRLVLRRPRGTDTEASLLCAEREARLLRFLADMAKAPRLVAFDVEAAVLVLEYVEGAPRFTEPLPRHFIEQLADQLATIHRRRADDALDFLPSRDSSVRMLLESQPERFDETLAERRVRAALGAGKPGAGNAPVLLHGDYWPGNILWRDDDIAAVIDWEECERGEPLSDLGVARLDLLWAFGAAAMEQFTECYFTRMNDLRRDNLPWWDLVAALRPMSHLARWANAYASPPISRPDITADSMRRDHQWFVAQAIASIRR